MLCGAWFALGPFVWPVISSSGGYFVAASRLSLLEYELGYSIGTGLIIVMCGAFVDGWASRLQGAVADPTVQRNVVREHPGTARSGA